MGQAKLLLVSVLFLMRVETIRPMRDYLRGELTIYGDHTHGVPEGGGGWEDYPWILRYIRNTVRAEDRNSH